MEGGGTNNKGGVIGINKLLEGGVIEFFQGEWGGIKKMRGVMKVSRNVRCTCCN